MMAGKNQAALAVCAQSKVIFPFKLSSSSGRGNINGLISFSTRIFTKTKCQVFSVVQYIYNISRSQLDHMQVYQTDRQTDGRAQTNMPLTSFEVGA